MYILEMSQNASGIPLRIFPLAFPLRLNKRSQKSYPKPAIGQLAVSDAPFYRAEKGEKMHLPCRSIRKAPRNGKCRAYILEISQNASGISSAYFSSCLSSAFKDTKEPS